MPWLLTGVVAETWRHQWRGITTDLKQIFVLRSPTRGDFFVLTSVRLAVCYLAGSCTPTAICWAGPVLPDLDVWPRIVDKEAYWAGRVGPIRLEGYFPPPRWQHSRRLRTDPVTAVEFSHLRPRPFHGRTWFLSIFQWIWKLQGRLAGGDGADGGCRRQDHEREESSPTRRGRHRFTPDICLYLDCHLIGEILFCACLLRF